MWTAERRARYDRSGLRYPSDLTDAEWALIAPLIPPAKRGGRRREVNVREVVNGLPVGQRRRVRQCLSDHWRSIGSLQGADLPLQQRQVVHRVEDDVLALIGARMALPALLLEPGVEGLPGGEAW